MNTKIQRNQRLERILNLLKEGYSRKLVKSTIQQEYSISDSQLDKDFMLVNEMLIQSNKDNADSLKIILNDRLECLYDKALQSNKIDTCLKVIDQQSKLNGLYVEKQEIDLNNQEFKIEIG